ncbi:hypothetical protein KF840_24000 [bacterium]|nr:hypothetical protein [bacterium]
MLTASTPITSGAHSLYLSIFDQGDNVFDSAVFVDRLVVGTASPGGCEPGAKLCGNGIVDAGEQCDDGNSSSGDCCDSDCQYEPAGSACSDHDACTSGDVCNGAGACAGPTVLNCDDANACTADACDPMTGCVNEAGPATGCLTAAKGLFMIKNATDDAKDKLMWKWGKGAPVSQAALADPTGSTDYALCVYSGPGGTLVGAASLPAGSGWSALGNTGYLFKGTSPNGLTKALLKGGASGKPKAQAKGKGSALPDPALPLSYPVTVQLKKNGSSVCLESTFTAPDEVKNDIGQFKAKK